MFEATSSFLLLLVRHLATSSFLFLVVVPFTFCPGSGRRAQGNRCDIELPPADAVGLAGERLSVVETLKRDGYVTLVATLVARFERTEVRNARSPSNDGSLSSLLLGGLPPFLHFSTLPLPAPRTDQG